MSIESPKRISLEKAVRVGSVMTALGVLGLGAAGCGLANYSSAPAKQTTGTGYRPTTTRPQPTPTTETTLPAPSPETVSPTTLAGPEDYSFKNAYGERYSVAINGNEATVRTSIVIKTPALKVAGFTLKHGTDYTKTAAFNFSCANSMLMINGAPLVTVYPTLSHNTDKLAQQTCNGGTLNREPFNNVVGLLTKT